MGRTDPFLYHSTREDPHPGKLNRGKMADPADPFPAAAGLDAKNGEDGVGEIQIGNLERFGLRT
jgi:hypothetical protein